MENKIALESLTMDLKRVALGYHCNSLTMAQRFYQEALARKNEINTAVLKPYIIPFLERIEKLQSKTNEAIAEESLLISTLLQNYTQKYL